MKISYYIFKGQKHKNAFVRAKIRKNLEIVRDTLIGNIKKKKLKT